MDPVAFPGHRGGRVLCVRCLDQTTAISGGDAPSFALLAWSLATGKELRRFVGHNGPVTNVKCAGQLLVSSSDDATVRLWRDDGSTVAVFALSWRVSDVVLARGGVVAVGEADAARFFKFVGPSALVVGKLLHCQSQAEASRGPGSTGEPRSRMGRCTGRAH